MDLLRHLRYFIAVAEELHFGRAAARLHMSQPPLSQRIQRLEKQLGVRLFDRSARSVALTRAGHLLLGEARDLIHRADALSELAIRLRDDDTGPLDAGLPPELPGATLAALVAEFAARQPAVVLRPHEMTPAAQQEALAERRLDVGVLRLPFDTGLLTLGPVVQRPLGVLLARTDPLAGRPELLLSELGHLTLVLSPRTAAPAVYDEIVDTCARHGYRPSAVHEVNNVEFGRGLVLAGGACAFDDGTTPAPEDAVWRPLTGQPLTRRITTAWPRGREHPAVRAFAEAITTVLRREAGMTIVGPDRPTPLHARPVSEFLPWGSA
ncbi:LysR family transcriptional regulator [Micromonospora sp. NPDC003197]